MLLIKNNTKIRKELIKTYGVERTVENKLFHTKTYAKNARLGKKTVCVEGGGRDLKPHKGRLALSPVLCL